MNDATDAVDFLIADMGLEYVIDDVEADLTPEIVNVLRATGEYHRVVGYLAERKAAGIAIPAAGDPLLVDNDGGDSLAAIIAEWERSHEGTTRGMLRPGQQ